MCPVHVAVTTDVRVIFVGGLKKDLVVLLSKKRRKRAQLAEFGVFDGLQQRHSGNWFENGFLRAMARRDSNNYHTEEFLEKSCRAVVFALLRCSSQDKKNEPAFYKALKSVKPAIDSAAWHSRRNVRYYYYDQYLGR